MAHLTTNDLLPSELQFVLAMQKLGFGHFEAVQIRAGELVVDPWPRMVQAVRFGSGEGEFGEQPEDFQLKKQAAQLFERVRMIGQGEIRQLEVRHGLPFAMQLECTQL